MSNNRATIKFHGSLLDFTGEDLLSTRFFLNPSVKDVVESNGIPHVEIFGIKINGNKADFSHNLSDGDFVELFPKEMAGKNQMVSNIKQKENLSETFIADVHLGKTARLLRLLGVDTIYSNNTNDADIIKQSIQENRAVLTRDIGLLKHGSLMSGYWLRSTDPEEQLKEVISYFELNNSFKPFTRCLECNGLLQPVTKERVSDKLPPKVRQSFDSFKQCGLCGKVYWKGTHYKQLLEKVTEVENVVK